MALGDVAGVVRHDHDGVDGEAVLFEQRAHGRTGAVFALAARGGVAAGDDSRAIMRPILWHMIAPRWSLKRTDFAYELPPERIAQEPRERGRSRMMVVTPRRCDAAHRARLVRLLSDAPHAGRRARHQRHARHPGAAVREAERADEEPDRVPADAAARRRGRGSRGASRPSGCTSATRRVLGRARGAGVEKRDDGTVVIRFEGDTMRRRSSGSAFLRCRPTSPASSRATRIASRTRPSTPPRAARSPRRPRGCTSRRRSSTRSRHAASRSCVSPCMSASGRSSR